jgi:SAM-dependent methyltransferase
VAEDHFGEHVAERFDERNAHQADPAVVDPMVAFIADLAGSGAVLEFGVGTGRVALPLAQRGVGVHGIDLSEAMIARMRAKPGSDGVVATVGDFATTRVEGVFSVVYLVANTIMNLTTQDDQVECFRNAAAHLEPHGTFVIEVLVPRLQRLPPGETFQLFDVGPTHVGFDEYDLVRQGLVSHHLWIEDGRVDVNSPPFRYVWPSELDLMARLAGMTLRERWGGWEREPFTADSAKHVSVWERVAAGPI